MPLFPSESAGQEMKGRACAENPMVHVGGMDMDLEDDSQVEFLKKWCRVLTKRSRRHGEGLPGINGLWGQGCVCRAALSLLVHSMELPPRAGAGEGSGWGCFAASPSSVGFWA